MQIGDLVGVFLAKGSVERLNLVEVDIAIEKNAAVALVVRAG